MRPRIADWSAKRVVLMWLMVISIATGAAVWVTLLPDYVNSSVTLVRPTVTPNLFDSLLDSVQPDSIPNQAKQTATDVWLGAMLLLVLGATIATSSWFAKAKPHVHWRLAKVCFLWLLAVTGTAIARSLVSRDDRDIVYFLVSPLAVVLVVITWTWLTARE